MWPFSKGSSKRMEIEARIGKLAVTNGRIAPFEVSAFIKEAKVAGVVLREAQVQAIGAAAIEAEKKRSSNSKGKSSPGKKKKRKQRVLSPSEAAAQRTEHIKMGIAVLVLVAMMVCGVYLANS